MAASINVDRTGIVLSSTQYQYRWEATAAVDMPREVFLISFSTNQFMRVCLSADMIYPTTRTVGQSFYRSISAIGVYESIEIANSRAAQISTDIQALVDAYNAGLPGFATTTTEVFS